MSQRTPIRFFLLDPVFAIVLAALLVVGGLVSYTSMVRENNPDLAIPQATVSTFWAGASPNQMEKEVTKPIEDEIRSLPGLRTYSSSSQNSFSLLTVQFEANVEIEYAMGLLRAKVDTATAELPKVAEKPLIEQISVNDLPIMTVALTGNVDALTLDRAAAQLSRDLERIQGVRKTEIQGDRGEAVHIRLIPDRMRSLGLSPADVRARVISSNQDLAWGTFEAEDGTTPLYLSGRLTSVDDFKNIIVARNSETSAVRLGDLAEVSVGLKRYRGETSISLGGAAYDGGITMSILKRPGEDTISTIERVRAFVATLPNHTTWPSDVSVSVVSDEGEIINASFNEVQSNLVQGVIAVFVVLLIALTWRAAAVAAIALPITLLGALAVINIFGFTLNTLVTLGMVIALGILVDVFILVTEGMHEGMSVRGETFEEAAVATVKTFFLPALAGQMTTILAMVPLMIIGGVDGKFVRLIPFTAIACLVISLVIAFVVCIPLSRYFMKEHKPGSEEGMTAVDKLTKKASHFMQKFLVNGPVRDRGAAGVTVGLAVTAFAASIFIATQLETIVYPKEDRRSLGVTVELRPDAGYDDTRRVADKVGDYLKTREEFSSIFVHAGEVSPYSLPTIDDYLMPADGPSLVGASVRFAPKEDRDQHAYKYVPDIRAGLEEVLSDEAGVIVRLIPDLGGATAGDPIQIEVRGEDISQLKLIAGEVSDELRKIAGVTDVRDTLGPFRTEARFTANSEALSFYGLDESELMEQVRAAMIADKIGTFQMPGSQPDLDILLGTTFASRAGEIGGPRQIYELDALTIVNSEGRRVPLTSLVDMTFQATPIAILHSDGQRSVTIKARVSGDTTASSAIEAIVPVLDEMKLGWLDGYSYKLRGVAESTGETFGRTQRALGLALFLVFAVMALLFGSFRQPLIIMAMVPLSLTGVFLGFFLLGIPISFAAMIGVIALIGIVVNDAIVMVEVINKRREEGMSKVEAAAHGASDRLRPILTTSITTVAGLLPLALSSPAWYPLCMAVILGLSIATIFALIVIPALYVVLEGAQDKFILPTAQEAPA